MVDGDPTSAHTAGMRSEPGVAMGDRIRPLAGCAVMAALLAVLSWVALPLPISPVPVTLQTLAVFLAGGLLGPRWGVVAVLAYVLLGVGGVPVFAGGEAGLGVLAGPKGGYLVGFLPAAALVGVGSRLSARLSRTIFQIATLAGFLLAAALCVYSLGVGWLMLVAHLTPGQAAILGAVPFLPGEVLKLAAAIALIRSLRHRLRHFATETL